jgi:hypothetical protein
MILALAAIGWVIMQGSSGEGEKGALPQGYQQPLEEARGLEQSVLDSAEDRLKALDEQTRP